LIHLAITCTVWVVLTLSGKAWAKAASCTGRTICGAGTPGATGLAAAAMIEARVLAMKDQMIQAKVMVGPAPVMTRLTMLLAVAEERPKTVSIVPTIGMTWRSKAIT